DLVAKQIDSQAIPLLRSYLSARGPTETMFYRRFYRAMPVCVEKLLPEPGKKSRYRQNATWMLWQLKSNAQPALPELIFALSNPQSDGPTRELVARTLIELGPKAQPAV